MEFGNIHKEGSGEAPATYLCALTTALLPAKWKVTSALLLPNRSALAPWHSLALPTASATTLSWSALLMETTLPAALAWLLAALLLFLELLPRPLVMASPAHALAVDGHAGGWSDGRSRQYLF